jgi:hypothetical protein
LRPAISHRGSAEFVAFREALRFRRPVDQFDDVHRGHAAEVVEEFSFRPIPRVVRQLVGVAANSQSVAGRDAKKPACPNTIALNELALASQLAAEAGRKGDDGAVILSRREARRATRLSGAFPAMMAALIAPMEMRLPSQARIGTSTGPRRRQLGSCRGSPFLKDERNLFVI